MFAVNEYEEIIKREKQLSEKHIIVFLFVKPSLSGFENVIKEFNYIHHNAGRYCSVYAIGYSNDLSKQSDKDYVNVTQFDSYPWFYSDKYFVKFVSNLEKRLKWEYSGEMEILVLQSNPEGKHILNFQNYVSIDVNHGIKEGYISSFNKFMNSLVRASRSEVTSKKAINKVNNSRLKIKDVVSGTIDNCKKIPDPIRKIVKDRLFLKTSNYQ